jgi:ketosteroid isomerase-like protein
MLRAFAPGEMTHMVTMTDVRRWAACVALLALAAPGAARADAFADMVAAERAFAADALARNVRDAFLAAAADDAVVFSAGPHNAKAFWTARPADKTRLEWAPEAGEVAASGDLGYTYGPWILTPEGAEKPAAFGHFFTVWQKQADGTWHWLADKGIFHDALPLPATAVRRGQVGFKPAAPSTLQSTDLLAELRLADQLPAGQVTPVVIAPDFLRFRPSSPPGPATESPAFPHVPATSFEAHAVISAAGDLAATWGGSPGGASWVRVWRRAGVGDPPGLGWRMVADVSDVVAPAPAESEQ